MFQVELPFLVLMHILIMIKIHLQTDTRETHILAIIIIIITFISL